MQQNYGRRRTAIMVAALLCTALMAIDSSPAPEKNAVYYNKKGWEYLEKADPLKAVLMFKNAIKKNASYKDAILGLAKAYLKTEAFEESSRLFDRALTLDDNNTHILAGKGFALAGLGRLSQALSFFERAIAASAENLDAKYGIAYIYFLMDKNIWAKRKLNHILSVNPYHYDSLLLMADIRSAEKRLDDAKKYVEKAIAASPELPQGYIIYGSILLREYLKKDRRGYLSDAADEFGRAIALQPDNFLANRYMGFIMIFQERFDRAVEYLYKSYTVNPANVGTLYGLAYAHERGGNREAAHKYFMRVQHIAPSDNIVQNKIEEYLVLGGYRIGFPTRIDLSEYHLKTARKRMKEGMPHQAMYHLRRCLLLNPLNREARELLRDYYQTLDYYRFYVDEIKTLLRLYPDRPYREALELAVVKRRNRLEQQAGYALEDPPRDVPIVLVTDFDNGGEISTHYDSNKVIANTLTFALAQFGRLSVVGVKKRISMLAGIKNDDSYLENVLERLARGLRIGRDDVPLPVVRKTEAASDPNAFVARADIVDPNAPVRTPRENSEAQTASTIKTIDLEPGGPQPAKIDFVIFGSCREGINYLSLEIGILNYQNGVIVDRFTLFETGKENLSSLCLRAAQRIYDLVLYKGRVLKLEDDQVLVNLGSFDGLKQGDLFVIYRDDLPKINKETGARRKIMLAVEEADTLISTMKPVKAEDIKIIDENNIVYPYTKRRARLIE